MRLLKTHLPFTCVMCVASLSLLLSSRAHADCRTLPLSQAYLSQDSLTLIERPPTPLSPTSPIVIGLHGLGHHKEGFSKLASVFPKSWRLIFIDAPFQYHRGYAWYRFKCPQRDADLAFSTQALIRRVRQLKERYPQAPLAIFGFSQGGVMTLSALEREPRLWSSAASLSGYWGYLRSPQLEGRSAPPLLITHGRHDQVVPFQRGQESAELMSASGVRVTPLYVSGGHRVTRGALKALITHIQTALKPKRAVSTSPSSP